MTLIADSDILLDDFTGRFRDIAEAIGVEAAMKVVRLCGGGEPYVPTLDACQRKAKYRKIYEEWKSSRSTLIYSELARKFRLSEGHVRVIVRAEHTRRYNPPQQASLF